MVEDQSKDPQSQSSGDIYSELAPPKTSLWRSIWHRFGDTVRYLYFMRFSLLLWLSMVVFAWVDFYPGAASITRGILTPSGSWQWFFTGFAVVLPGWFALLAARIVCAYGHERFGTEPPPCFHIHNRMEWFVFWGAQIPGLMLLLRVAYNVVHEGEGSYSAVYLCLTLGGIGALLFWYLVAILYYWIWDPDSTIPVRAFLVPKWRLLPLQEIEQLSRTSSIRLFGKFLGLLRLLGPGYKTQGLVNPGHIVASIAFFCAVIMYFLLMAISAPIRVPNLARAGSVLAFGFAIYVVFDFLIPSWKWLYNVKASARARWLPMVSSFIMLLLLLFAALQWNAPHVIPVIAYVAILLMVVFWTMAGVAFFADHFRLPVLTLVTLTVLALNHWPAEHVFPAEPMPVEMIKEEVKDPKAFVQRIAGPTNAEPVVIVTATGGGIHAAAWTATVLRALDKEFGDLHLHNHILLMSTVSGGSVATAGFLREYFTNQAFNEASYDRIQGAAACSSLQAVAWGLAYPDTLRLLFPFVFDVFPSLDRFDRGWALQKALDRNFRDRECVQNDKSRNLAGPDLTSMTLNSLARLDEKSAPCIGHEDACLHFPAFTFNSTVVETGDRFLLSNYSVFAGEAGASTVLPAASFLGVYGRRAILPLPKPVADVPGRGLFADLSLLTAARLSASFTYVSPAARLPFEMAQGKKKNAYHFVDGGYYDNDGTNSAIEFLDAAAASEAFTKIHPLRVLLIEIRNTDDINTSDSPDSYGFQSGLKWQNGKWDEEAEKKKRFGPIDQLAAPPEAALYAGFSSVTRRNRRELDTLKSALCESLDLQHVVLDYQQKITYKGKKKTSEGNKETNEGESEVAPPLSWHLTRRQLDWIEGKKGKDGKEVEDETNGNNVDPLNRKKPTSDSESIQRAVQWFREAQAKSGGPLKLPDACNSQFLGAGKARN